MLGAGFIKFHQMFQKLFLMEGGGHYNSAFYSAKLCVMINFSLHQCALLKFCCSFVLYVYLMKEVVMCNKNLSLKSPLKVNRHYSLLKHLNFDFALFRGGGGDTYLKSDFRRRG